MDIVFSISSISLVLKSIKNRTMESGRRYIQVMMERCCGVTQAFVSRAFHHVSVSLYRLGAPPRSPRIGVATRTIASQWQDCVGRLYGAIVLDQDACCAI